jgi:hypothetical protein
MFSGGCFPIVILNDSEGSLALHNQYLGAGQEILRSLALTQNDKSGTYFTEYLPWRCHAPAIASKIASHLRTGEGGVKRRPYTGPRTHAHRIRMRAAEAAPFMMPPQTLAQASIALAYGRGRRQAPPLQDRAQMPTQSTCNFAATG